MKWNDTDEIKVVELLKEGNSYDEIAKKLQRSKKSIKEKLNRLGFNFEDFKELYFYENKNCIECNIEFKSLKSEERKFCSHSCSASFNNRVREIKNIDIECLYCGNTIEKNKKTKHSKYCSHNCQHQYQWELKKKEIRKGEVSLNKPLRKYKIEEDGHICQICKKEEWEGKIIPLVLDHIDGNPYNNLPFNLRMICPNCDAQTETYKGKNKGNGRHERMKRYYEGKSF